MKRFLKMALLILGGLILSIVLFAVFFINLSPQFGASKKEKLTDVVTSSENHNGGVFHNTEETTVMTEFKWGTLREYFKKDGKEPKEIIPVKKLNNSDLHNSPDTTPRFTWFGHSAVYLELEGKRIFIDPMLSDVPAPLPFLGPKRFNPEIPISIDSIPELDVVLISHDHYDHLDYKSILKLKDKTKQFIAPLGVGAHLKAWGVEPERITELDWWDSTGYENIKFVAAPSRHFSGRGLTDRNTTLWCSFVIQSENSSLFFSGDGGYGNHFKQIGEKYGPFDICFMECGQYNEQWAQIHLMPEDIITANNELGGRKIFPIHWGAFKLALHPWTEPVERLFQATDGNSEILLTPYIGETVIIGEDRESTSWWESYK